MRFVGLACAVVCLVLAGCYRPSRDKVWPPYIPPAMSPGLDGTFAGGVVVTRGGVAVVQPLVVEVHGAARLEGTSWSPAGRSELVGMAENESAMFTGRGAGEGRGGAFAGTMTLLDADTLLWVQRGEDGDGRFEGSGTLVRTPGGEGAARSDAVR